MIALNLSTHDIIMHLGEEEHFILGWKITDGKKMSLNVVTESNRKLIIVFIER